LVSTTGGFDSVGSAGASVVSGVDLHAAKVTAIINARVSRHALFIISSWIFVGPSSTAPRNFYELRILPDNG
jgi:hypothetical protein